MLGLTSSEKEKNIFSKEGMFIRKFIVNVLLVGPVGYPIRTKLLGGVHGPLVSS